MYLNEEEIEFIIDSLINNGYILFKKSVLFNIINNTDNKDNNKYVKFNEATYLCPTYFQPGFYPTNSFPDLNAKSKKNV